MAKVSFTTLLHLFASRQASHLHTGLLLKGQTRSPKYSFTYSASSRIRSRVDNLLDRFRSNVWSAERAVGRGRSSLRPDPRDGRHQLRLQPHRSRSCKLRGSPLKLGHLVDSRKPRK